MGEMCLEMGILEPPTKLSDLCQDLKDRVCKSQGALTQIWDDLLGEKFDSFDTAWLLLDEKERTRHSLKGLEDACQLAAFGQDSRALCPEITVSAMLQLNGAAFTRFLSEYQSKVRGVTVGSPYLFPSEWWDKAVKDLPQSLSEKFGPSVFEFLTLLRNEFISKFVTHTAMSIMHDLIYGSPGMDPVQELMESDGPFARGMSKSLASMRDKPIIRCENCTKTPEEIQANAKFMVCSSCKSKLDFTIHYCSQACQKEDWRNHKKHCGKKKVSKKLAGTAHDPWWAHPDTPEHIRKAPIQSSDGRIQMTSTGFPSPNSTRQCSPALQRQISLLTADKAAEYYLFDESNQPVRVVLYDTWMKMNFRNFRMNAWSDDEKGHHFIPPMAQYLIKLMGRRPGLSRERILRQFDEEYGADATAKVEEFERIGVEKGQGEETFLEMISRGMTSQAVAQHLMK